MILKHFLFSDDKRGGDDDKLFSKWVTDEKHLSGFLPLQTDMR